VTDLTPSNVLKDENGKLQVIDCDIEMLPQSQENSNSVFSTVAPYYYTPITKRNFKQIRDAVHKDYLKKANTIASLLGLKVKGVTTNMGAYVYEEGKLAGKQVKELSYTFEFEEADTALVETFSALMGDLAYEQQESVITAEYVELAREANAIEASLQVNSLEGVEKILKKNGFENYTLHLDTNTISILEFDTT